MEVEIFVWMGFASAFLGYRFYCKDNSLEAGGCFSQAMCMGVSAAVVWLTRGYDCACGAEEGDVTNVGGDGTVLEEVQGEM